MAADVSFDKSLRRKKRNTKATVKKMTRMTTKRRTATRSERSWFQQIIGIQFGAKRSYVLPGSGLPFRRARFSTG
jgi:hypothetical protein